jgi:hypothetical protein
MLTIEPGAVIKYEIGKSLSVDGALIGEIQSERDVGASLLDDRPDCDRKDARG